MATKKKAAKKAAAPKAKPVKLKTAAPLLNESVDLAGITLSIEFRMGKGNVTATLFRNGKKIDTQNIAKTGDINFKTGQKDDIISVNGSCSGTAKIVVKPDTNPATPVKFPAGPIHQIFHVL